MATPPLATARLALEPLRVGHAEEMVDLLADRTLYAFYDDEPSPDLEGLRERYARQSLGSSADGTEVWHNWILRVRELDEVAGFVQATVTVGGAGAPTAELAWVVGSAYQGQGYATEAARAVRDQLVAEGALTVVAHVAPGHVASEAVARHLGLAPTDVVHAGEIRWELHRPR